MNKEKTILTIDNTISKNQDTFANFKLINDSFLNQDTTSNIYIYIRCQIISNLRDHENYRFLVSRNTKNSYLESTELVLLNTDKDTQDYNSFLNGSHNNIKNNNAPKIRFREYKENWKNDNFSNIFDFISDKGHCELQILSTFKRDGMIPRNLDIHTSEITIKNYKKIEKGDFVNHLSSYQYGFSYSDFVGITSPAYDIFRIIDIKKQVDLFWKYFFMSEDFIKSLKSITYGIRQGKKTSSSEIKDFKFFYPIEKEQQKIGSFFQNIDILLKNIEQKTEKIQSLKNFLLQKMFPKNNKKSPK
ncbi:hypothetical protein WG616_03490 [[Mycoplasma] gypis]|uniref:Uncharacterized protein n=1 Tax=[Mycoplasma] gypis TaxID=92404 RepID=A0ABZ2RUK1_9BACT